ncbi:MAG: malate dehydrogenase [Bacteroidota bacterium]|nr:malate dehydrogenase [Candidatus Kapabacteria bacterium]MDW8220989.1 malate dehydrogenase [Bacteroidota bacterium]
MKITVIGAGNVGATAAQKIAYDELAHEVVLVDVIEDLPQGKSLDMFQAMPILGSDTRVIGTNTYEPTAGSDIVIMTAGLARKPGMSRDDLLFKNADIVQSCIERAYALSPNAFFIIVSNPLDVMTYVALKTTGLPRHKVIGMAGVLDTARYRTFIAMELGVSVEDITAFVLGGHGDTMVPLPRFTTVAGVPLAELMPQDRIDAIVKRTANGGAEIVSLLKTGSAYYAPSAAAVEMAECIIKDKRRILPCAVWLEGEYGLRDVVCGVPIILGKNGMERIFEIKLSADEQAALAKSADDVRSNIAKLTNV